MLRVFSKRDLLGGSIICLFGIVGTIEGDRLGYGTLREMGPGFVPMSLGIILICLGLVMALKRARPGNTETATFSDPQWRGWICILLGVVSFIVLGQYLGLVPASFACVLVSAMGDRTATFKGGLLLSTGVTIFGVALFHYVLGISIPLFSSPLGY